MSLKLEIREAENEAILLVKKLNIISLPICPFKIAREENIVVEPKNSDKSGVSGFLIRVGNVFGIKYASHIKNDGFIRFTVAHELGHYFLSGHPEHFFHGKDGVHMSKSGFISDDSYEKQADYFAKELLMPEDIFLEALRKAGEGFAAIKSLAIKCRTSITSTAIRYAQLSENPVAVIMSSRNKVDWCFMSSALISCRAMQWIKKGSLITPTSTTAEFNQDQNNVLMAKRVEAWTRLDYWFEDGPQIEMKEDVVGLGHYGKTLTVLFTNEAIDTEDDDEYLEIGDENRDWKWK